MTFLVDHALRIAAHLRQAYHVKGGESGTVRHVSADDGFSVDAHFQRSIGLSGNHRIEERDVVIGLLVRGLDAQTSGINLVWMGGEIDSFSLMISNTSST